jgi:DNA-binding PadR family transcriptional regulator
MEERRLVTSAWDLAESGPAKRMFDLTAAGRECMAKWVTTIETYHRQVGQLLQYLRQQAGSARPGGCGCSKKSPGKSPARKRNRS